MTQDEIIELKKQGIYVGMSKSLSLAEAIEDAINQDPRSDPGTDLFNYTIIETLVEFGGFMATYTLFVKLKRTKPKI